MSPGQCSEHSAIEEKTTRNEKDIQRLWGANAQAHRRIDSMKNWVIAGMSSLIIEVGLMIFGLILAYFKFKGG